ncbi:MAG: ABC transporter substrate-binding protein [Chloroflexi bacterium]|nr:ABC transporter substrate-binding protein [Chloroflexota bacterium]
MVYQRRVLTRRSFIGLQLGVTGAALLAACAPSTPAAKPTEAPKPASQPAAQPTAQPAAKPAAQPTTAPAAPAAAKPTAAPTTAPAAAKPTAVAAKPEAKPAASGAEKPGKQLIGKLEGPEIIVDPAKLPTKRAEAPMLADLVKAGKLPPVAERLPEQPLVVKPLHQIGKYGGTWRRAFTGPADRENGQRIVSVDKLIFRDYTGNTLVPSLATSWEWSDGGRVLTAKLRKGTKWSDGHPFTADDIIFWFEDLYQNKDLNPVPTLGMFINGKPGTIEKVDDFTVAFKFPDPYYLFEEHLSGNTPVGNGHATAGNTFMGLIAPAHYLKQFHAKYVPKEQLDKITADAKFDSWVSLMKFKNDWALNPEVPVLTPWRTVSPINTPSWTLERNPYYWSVDTEGNQLPYIDKIAMALNENLQVLNLHAIAGEFDIQGRHEMIQMLPVYLENAPKQGYKVHLDTGDYGAEVQLYVNQSYEADPEIAKWIRNADFRRALSIAIDRDQLNEAFWLGTGTPGSPVVDESHPHNPGPEWRTKWATFDLKQANELLDKIGLTKKDSEGYRVRTDNGQRLRIEMTTIQAAWMDQTAVCQMIAQHWKQAGIQGDVKELERSLMERMTANNELMISIRDASTVGSLATQPTAVIPATPDSGLGPFFGRWYSSNGQQGMAPTDPQILKVFDLYRSLGGLPAKERDEVCKEIWRIAIDQVWGIGTVGLASANLGVRVVRDVMGNVPDRLSQVRSARHPGASHPSTYYFKS